MQLLFTYLKKHRRTLIGALTLALIHQIFTLIDPQIYRIVIDKYATRIHEYTTKEFTEGVLVLILLAVLVAFISRTARSFQDFFVSKITQKVGTELYANSVGHAFSLPFSVFEDQRSGALLQKLQKARTDAQNLITSSINVVFLSGVGIIIVVTYAFFVHPIVGLMYLLLIPTIGIIAAFLNRRIKKLQKEIVAQSSELAGSTTETLRNVELVKSLGIEGQEVKRLNDTNDQILELELKKVKLVRTLSFIQGTMINGVRSGIVFVMLYFVFKEAITLGEYFTLLFYSFAVFNPLYEFGTVATNFQEAKASLEELDEVLSLKKEEKPGKPVTLKEIQSFEFNTVSFGYESASNEAVSNISVKAKKGETIAFAGPSGSGKSTLIKLLLGLYKAKDGDVVINQTSISELDIEEYRSKIGLVSQDTQLFAGTIRENLLFVSPDASDEECMEALRKASALSIIERGSEGLDTRIGEGGLKLSGGEKQRLAIARALLRDPDLIVFDEATSSLDSITEKAITETIKQISEKEHDTITLLVAHRLSTIAHADRIYVLEKGKIVETGTHTELISHRGLYAAMWREQQMTE